jgi:signal transduction histidine kinase
LFVALVLLWSWSLLPTTGIPSPDVAQRVSGLLFATLLVAPTWLIGRFNGRRRARATEFQELATRTAIEHDGYEASAIEAERSRIRIEMEDVIAHCIGAMVIQTGSARLVLTSDPDRARDAILDVEATGRQTLTDLRRLVGMLRIDDRAGIVPPPGLGHVTALADSLRGAGLMCERQTVGDPIALSPGIDLVAYRVIETALRAAVGQRARHSTVAVRYRPHDLELEVWGDRSIPDLDATFLPLTRRLALYAGDLRTEADGNGFVLYARLPLATGSLG